MPDVICPPLLIIALTAGVEKDSQLLQCNPISLNIPWFRCRWRVSGSTRFVKFVKSCENLSQEVSPAVRLSHHGYRFGQVQDSR